MKGVRMAHNKKTPNFSNAQKRFKDPDTGIIYDAVFVAKNGFTDHDGRPIPANSWALRPRVEPTVIISYPSDEEENFIRKFEPYNGS